jgi:MFS family permease
MENSGRATFEQWRVVAMLVACVLVNYLDRLNLSVANLDIARDLNATPAEMGRLLSAFFISYTGCLLLSGWLLDRFDVYKVLAFGFFVMSAATALTAAIDGYAQLYVLRLAVGASAAIAFPAFSKIIAAGFRESQRGKANALIDAGTKAAPALIIVIGGLMLTRWSWRVLFASLGLASLVWLPFWFRWRPRTLAVAKAAAIVHPPGFGELLSKRSVWGSFIGLYCLNSAWYFLITWFPAYLQTERHFSKARMAMLGSIPFWLLAASTTLSGWAADRWIARGGNPTVVRKTFLVTGMLMCNLLFVAAVVPDDSAAIAIFTVACATFGMTTSNHWGVTQTLAGPTAAGRWTSLQNAFGNLAGIAMPWITGEIVGRTKSFRLAFVLVAVLVTLGAVSYALVIGRVEQIRWRDAA